MDCLLTVPVNDAFGEESYQCCECNGQFIANWADETVTPTVNLSLEAEAVKTVLLQAESLCKDWAV